MAGRGKIDVAIFSSAHFDATQIDINSLRFGRTCIQDSLSRNPAHGTPRYKVSDVDGDGWLDLIVSFETELTGFCFGDTLGHLTGRTLSGESLFGSDSVSIRNKKDR